MAVVVAVMAVVGAGIATLDQIVGAGLDFADCEEF